MLITSAQRSESANQLRERIKARMTGRLKRHYQLAKRIGLSQSGWSDVWNGKNSLSPMILTLLVKVLKPDPDEAREWARLAAREDGWPV